MSSEPLESSDPILPPSASRRLEPASWSRVAFSGAAFVGLLALSLPVILRPQAYELDGTSTYPAIRPGERVLVDLGAYGFAVDGVSHLLLRHSEPQPGELVLITSRNAGFSSVKRVVGVGGDRIAMRDGRLVRNGRPVTRESSRPCPDDYDTTAVCRIEVLGDARYEVAMSSQSPLDDVDEVVVPDGTVYVLGDHRDHSNDSRHEQVGFVPVDEVVGRVRFRVADASRMPRFEVIR